MAPFRSVHSMKFAVVQTLWARLVVGTLVRAGLKHVVVSPGSRSTPLLAALLAQAHVRIHSVLDERSAGFVGIGLARACQEPVLLLCTSGTAAANYFPAIVEANESSVPLVVLTADRPTEAQFAHSPQTTNQIELYGSHVRRYVELGEAHAHVPALRSLQRTILSAVHLARFPSPGPVHLNARTRKPLEPALPDCPESTQLKAHVELLLAEAPQLPELNFEGLAQGSLQELATQCSESPRGIIVCGYDPQGPTLDADALAEFSEITGYPVWLDVAHALRWNHSQRLDARTLRCATSLGGSPRFLAERAPQIIVQVGAIPTSSQWEAWLEREGAPKHVLLSRQGWPDPSGRARWVFPGNPAHTLRRAAALLRPSRAPGPQDTSWFLECRHVDTRATVALESFIRDERPLSELHAVRAVLEACPRGTRIVLGNSLPIRDADLVWPAADRGQESFAQRGTNGIDGVASTAVGIALGSYGAVLLLLGDMSFLHDIGALYAARSVRTPLVIVVINNQGGRIFEQLPVANGVEDSDLPYWTTPHDCALEAAGAVYGIETRTPSGVAAIQTEVRSALGENRATLICIGVEPHSAREGAEILRQAMNNLEQVSAPSATEP